MLWAWWTGFGSWHRQKFPASTPLLHKIWGPQFLFGAFPGVSSLSIMLQEREASHSRLSSVTVVKERAICKRNDQHKYCGEAQLRTGRTSNSRLPSAFSWSKIHGYNISECVFTPRFKAFLAIMLTHRLLSYVYLLYCLGIAFFLLYMSDCWLEASIRKVLRPAISKHVFLGFPVSISKCWDGSQDSKLLLHASLVALRN